MRYYVPYPGGGGEPLRPRGPHTLRVGDAERDAAAADLGEHYTAGRLTLEELNERLDAVFSAKTFGQVAKVMADLPGPGRLSWGSGPWQAPQAPEPPMATDQAGRYAALALLLLAMLIWLFTVLLFARHGFYQQNPYGYGPPGPFSHYAQHARLLPDIQGFSTAGP